MMTRALFATAVLAAGIGTAPGLAEAQYWGSPANSCVPGRDPIQNDRYLLWYNYVSYNGANVDKISLYCPVTPGSTTNPNRVYLTALDSTNSGDATGYVKAEFCGISRTGGGYTCYATATSESVGGLSVKEAYATFSHTLNFVTNFYFVRIEMDRDTGDDVRAYGVALDYVPL